MCVYIIVPIVAIDFKCTDFAVSQHFWVQNGLEMVHTDIGHRCLHGEDLRLLGQLNQVFAITVLLFHHPFTKQLAYLWGMAIVSYLANWLSISFEESITTQIPWQPNARRVEGRSTWVPPNRNWLQTSAGVALAERPAAKLPPLAANEGCMDITSVQVNK